MNRLHQLKETLLKNIEDNAGYGTLEFILLDYNSGDGMEAWAKVHLKEFISQNRLVYFKTFEPVQFSHSHSKNLAFRLAGGDIVCHVNADNFTGPRFAEYINEAFNADENIVLTPIDFHKTRKNYFPTKDVLGRVCVKKEHFLSINGFDERMTNYGFEDYDFINRLELKAVKRVLIDNFSYLKYIEHDNAERYSINKITGNLHTLYVSHTNPYTSDILFLYKDHKTETGTLIDNTQLESHNFQNAYKKREYRFELSRKDIDWHCGSWEEDLLKDIITLDFENGDRQLFRKYMNNGSHSLCRQTDQKTFFPIRDPVNIENISTFNYMLNSRAIMEKNLQEKIIRVNPDGFGKGIVFKNFDTDIKIEL
jgi:hypothetical protein